MAEKTQAQKKAQQKYMEKFAVARVRMARERYELVQAHAQQSGESTNSFINHAIDQAINSTPEGPVSASSVQGVVLPSNTIEAVRGVSEATGEVLGDYVTRAVDTQVVRDRQSLRMGINPATGEKLTTKG